MKSFSCYSVRIKLFKKIFQDTVDAYRAAVAFFIEITLAEWAQLSALESSYETLSCMETLTIRTSKRQDVPFPFEDADQRFYKFPCYLRRAAINEAIGKVSSYQSNLANWEAADKKTRGKRPGYPSAGNCYPVLYRENMYEADGTYSAKIKVYVRNTWDWITVPLRKCDVDYIERHCQPVSEGTGPVLSRKICAPTLQKRYKYWTLDFPIEEKVTLSNTPIEDRTILAVDLGLNNACACSVMRSDGTVVGREFLKLPAENDSLDHALNKIKKAQRLGARRPKRLWASANGITDRIAVLTAEFIIDVATRYHADVIVMEYLDTSGKKKGSKKERMHLWKSSAVQAMVTTKAHRAGIRITHVCAWNTSRLAFDGSGRVLRGKESSKTQNNYSLCEFTSGKLYHADLNASYNIGARYFVRELTKPLSETARLQLEAKVPAACKRSTCTLSTLIDLNAVLAA